MSVRDYYHVYVLAVFFSHEGRITDHIEMMHEMTSIYVYHVAFDFSKVVNPLTQTFQFCNSYNLEEPHHLVGGVASCLTL